MHYHKISSLQVETCIRPPLVIGDRRLRSPLDSSLTPWKILPTQALFSNQYRCKEAFLEISKIIIKTLGNPNSVCMLADTIIGATGWEGISIEQQYKALQESAAVFESSSLTYLTIKGPDAEAILNKLTPRDLGQLKPGFSKFVLFTTDKGTVDDDAMILRLSEDEFLLSCGGSKLPKDTLTYLPQVQREFPNAVISAPTIISFNIKGPKRVAAMMNLIVEEDKSKVAMLEEYQFCKARFLNGDLVWVLKTKIGMEMWGSTQTIALTWQHMLKNPDTYTPCGWDVLHTFRMECEELMLTVYPFDIHEETTLWEIGCGWMTKEKSGDYLGKEALKTGKNSKLFELKKIKVADQRANMGTVLYKENGDFAGFITSAAFSIKSQCTVAFAHLLVSEEKVGPLIATGGEG